MNISKTLFKNLTRCSSFPSLYDLYFYRNLHHIKRVFGVDVSKTLQLMDGIQIDSFEEEDEEILNIFSHMFDEDSGEDLTVITNSQMEALSPYFSKVEELAADYISKKFSGKHIYNLDTKKQKKFSFTNGEHEYFCYLDIYSECDDGKIRVFEVKSTTSTKFYKLGLKKDKEEDVIKRKRVTEEYESIFLKGNDDVIRLREEYGDELNTLKLTSKKYLEKREKLFQRFISSGVGDYVYDLSVERYIIENSLKEQKLQHLVPKIEYYLIVLNGEYIFNGDYLNGAPEYKRDSNGNELFSIFDFTKITKESLDRIHNQKVRVEELIEKKEITPFCIGRYCDWKNSTQCKFQPVCFNPVLKDGSILEYIDRQYAFKDPNIYDLINQGKYMIDSIERNELKRDVNLIQYDCYVENKRFANPKKMELVLKTLEYPLYHLDFETFGCPLPRYFGETPYTQSPFQYSLHVEKIRGKCNKEENHLEYLAPDHDDHRRDLALKLIQDIDLSKGGTVIVYNQNFERMILKQLAILYPDLAVDLLNIRNRVFDLFHVLRGNKKMFEPFLKIDEKDQASLINFYDNRMHGSFSIKKVLPLFSSLSYNDLEVKNGTEAVLTYGLLPTFSPKEYDEKYLALRKYCQQDTWAMVEILWGLWDMIEREN